MKALQSCLSRFMNACTDMLEKYDDMRQEEVSLNSLSSMFSHAGVADVWDRAMSGICYFICGSVCVSGCEMKTAAA